MAVRLRLHRSLSLALSWGLMAACAAQGLDDFERTGLDLRSEVAAEHRAQPSLVPAPAGLGQGTALRIAWTAQRGDWVECCYQDEALRDLPPPAAAGTCTLGLALWVEAFADIKYLAVRACDQEGETFEWRVSPGDAARTGWRRLELQIGAATSSGHWGPWKDGVESGNGRIDPPLRLQGYAIAFGGEPAKAGQVLIDQVAAESGTKP